MSRILHLPDNERRLVPVALDDLVRLGRDNDGGYIVPRRMIEAADSVLALGLYDDWSFELELTKLRPQLRVDGYDHTISRRQFARAAWLEVLRLAALRGSFAEVRRRFATRRSYDSFFQGPNRHFRRKITNRPEGGSESNLSDALDRLGGERVLVKMDIEGAEYRVVDELSANAPRIVGACVEFHDTEPLRAVFDDAVDCLLPHFAIAHVHPNNYGKVADDGLPDALEITFVHRSLVRETGRRENIHLVELDQPNNPSRSELVIVQPPRP